MSRFVIRRKTSGASDTAPSADAVTRLSSPDYGALGRVMLEGSRFASFSEIAATSDALKALEKRKTLILDSELRAMQRLREETNQQYHVEPLIEYSKAQVSYDMFRAAPLDLSQMMRLEPLALNNAGNEKTFRVHVQGSGARHYQDLQHAQVHVFLSAPGGVRDRLRMETDKGGIARFSVASWYTVLAIVAYPYAYFAPTVVRGDQGQTIRVLCERLPRGSRRRTAWWHEVVGATGRADVPLGQAEYRPIRVGVVDSGCGPHPSLGHVRDVGAFIEGVHSTESQSGSDSATHGTHVCGIIGARGGKIPFQGIAPGVELFSARVFEPYSKSNQGDIADALDALVAEGVELVNLSLGSPQKSEILSDAVQAAYNEGTVCICAAGNNSGPVWYPAALGDTIAVSAIGQLGHVTASSLPAIPSDPLLFGALGYYAADFTNFGPQVGVAAPGVGIVATVPARFGFDQPYAMMNGTSMASPIASGSIAAILARSRDYLAMNGGRDRSRYVHTVAAVASNSVELPSDYEGKGVPNIATQWVKS